MKKPALNSLSISADNPKALFSLKVYRGEGMALLAMNFKEETPSIDFVGFAIEYKEPKGTKFFTVKNRIAFPDLQGGTQKSQLSSLLSPFQKFRWVHFPRNAEIDGEFTYRVTPVFMNSKRELSYGEAQTVALALKRETYPTQLNVTFTRGFVLSQAFATRYKPQGGIPALIPAKAQFGLDFKPSHPKAEEAYKWMGFEARSEIFSALEKAVNDPSAQVKIIAYELNLPEMVDILEDLGNKLHIIIDNSDDHGKDDFPETISAERLIKSGAQVKRQHMNQLQHNKMIIVKSYSFCTAICGSTNFSWRGMYVQANNALAFYGSNAIKPFLEAFEKYWENDSVTSFGITSSAKWVNIPLNNIQAKITFSPHHSSNLRLEEIAKDISTAQSSIFYSLAFLYQTPGEMRNAIQRKMTDNEIFMYGISDKEVGGLDLQKPDGNISPVYPSYLTKNLPEPFISEASGGSGNRMHHKFVVLDFNKPTARVYLGSYNFSVTADEKNGENLVLIEDQMVATSYMIEALRLFDHYHFRVAANEAKEQHKPLRLELPPKEDKDTWWYPYYNDTRKIQDRKLFS